MVVILMGCVWAVLVLLNAESALAVAGILGLVYPVWFILAFSCAATSRIVWLGGVVLSVVLSYSASTTILVVVCRYTWNYPHRFAICAHGSSDLGYVVLAMLCTLVSVLVVLLTILVTKRSRD
jgi:hypothetical protein